MLYTRKVTSLEARQYEGAKLVVISDSKGEQIANTGDFLVGTEPGKVFVVAKADFLAEYESQEEAAARAEAEEVAAQAKAVADAADAAATIAAEEATKHQQ